MGVHAPIGVEHAAGDCSLTLFPPSRGRAVLPLGPCTLRLRAHQVCHWLAQLLTPVCQSESRAGGRRGGRAVAVLCRAVLVEGSVGGGVLWAGGSALCGAERNKPCAVIRGGQETGHLWPSLFPSLAPILVIVS